MHFLRVSAHSLRLKSISRQTGTQRQFDAIFERQYDDEWIRLACEPFRRVSPFNVQPPSVANVVIPRTVEFQARARSQVWRMFGEGWRISLRCTKPYHPLVGTQEHLFSQFH